MREVLCSSAAVGLVGEVGLGHSEGLAFNSMQAWGYYTMTNLWIWSILVGVSPLILMALVTTHLSIAMLHSKF